MSLGGPRCQDEIGCLWTLHVDVRDIHGFRGSWEYCALGTSGVMRAPSINGQAWGFNSGSGGALER